MFTSITARTYLDAANMDAALPGQYCVINFHRSGSRYLANVAKDKGYIVVPGDALSLLAIRGMRPAALEGVLGEIYTKAYVTRL